MPAAVLDVEISDMPRQVPGLERYEAAHVLFRWHGRPVAQAMLPVHDGQLTGAQLTHAVADLGRDLLWEESINQYAPATPPAGQPNLFRVTVAICTRDRPDDVQRCLTAIAALPDDGQEVLVIDNCPSDDRTHSVVSTFAGVRYVREPRPGLDVARNRAIREAGHPIVAFCDDDAAPDAGWLRALQRNFADPRVACVTGLTMPLELETDAQMWFERYSPFGRGFKRRVFDGITHNPLHVSQIGAGANMALRRSVLRDVGLFDEALDAGTPTQSGGDHDMFSRLLAAGYRIVYEPAALSRHRHRRTWPELQRTIYGYGTGVYAVWTRRLLFERKFGVIRLAWLWFRHDHAPKAINWLLRRPGHTPHDLWLAELRGCLDGPRLYLASRRKLQAESR